MVSFAVAVAERALSWIANAFDHAPDEIITVTRTAGFRDAIHVSADELAARPFADRADGLRPRDLGVAALAAARRALASPRLAAAAAVLAGRAG